jgi:hypothetical protein
MKILFKVVAVETRVNPKDNSEFKSISMVKEKKVELNGCVTMAKLYADHACASTTLKAGDDFLFDSEQYNMVQRPYANAEGVTKVANSIFARAEV